jgi:hypothetical protein
LEYCTLTVGTHRVITRIVSPAFTRVIYKFTTKPVITVMKPSAVIKMGRAVSQLALEYFFGEC